MEKKFITAIVVGAFLLSGAVVWLASSEKTSEEVAEPSVPVYYYGDTCPHCKDVQKFIDENGIAEKVPFVKKEVWNDRKNAKEMAAREKTCGLKPEETGVPFLYFEGKCYVGTPQVTGFFSERAGLGTK